MSMKGMMYLREDTNITRKMRISLKDIPVVV